VCSTLRVVMSRGTAWGNVKIKGSGEFGVFNENEKSALTKHGFNYGANCGIIMYESVDAVIARLLKTADDEGRRLREQIRAEVNPAPKTFELPEGFVAGENNEGHFVENLRTRSFIVYAQPSKAAALTLAQGRIKPYPVAQHTATSTTVTAQVVLGELIRARADGAKCIYFDALVTDDDTTTLGHMIDALSSKEVLT
jgi:hypothetical protein